MKRLSYVDSYKGCLILLVIFGHSLQYVLGENCFNTTLWNIVYSFHMPCFFAVSGMFAHSEIDDYKTLLKMIWRRIRQLLVPMTFWQIILDISLPVSSFNPLKYLDCGSFWFLWCLFFICVLFSVTSFFAKLIRVKVLYMHIVISVILFLSMVFNIKDHGFHYITYYYPYYVLGYYLHHSSKIQGVKISIIWCLTGCWFFMALFWRMHDYPFYMVPLSFLPTTILVAFNRYFVGIVAVVAFGGLTKYYLNVERSEVISFWGTTSLALYTIHVSLFEIGQKNGLHLFDNACIEVITTCFLFLLFPSAIVLLIKKSEMLSTILLGKIK